MKSYFSVLCFALLMLVTGCDTYYTRNIKFQHFVLSGEMEKADKLLDNDKKGGEGKNQLLYYLNRGYVSFMLQKNDSSNHFFETADRIIEDQRKNIGLEALSLISNPNVKPYKPEDFETVMLNYFTSLNYIQLGKYEEALVECKRIDVKLNQLNDKYPANKNRYSRDAFAHTLMGLIYDANHNYNDAFIAYRNALNIYETDYAKNFNIQTPLQLKRDLLRTAYLTGFYDELHEYEDTFKMKYEPDTLHKPELVFFWLNGVGPVKSEWSINFTKIPGNAGWITLADPEAGLSFPFYLGNANDDERNAFSQLRFMRVAFPKYVERKPVFSNAQIVLNNQRYPAEMVQNINDIAFKTLHDRMVREMATSLLRMATKKALEAEVSKENKNLGTLVSITNALTEKADTRGWQTLPYSISYIRVPLNVGENNFKLYVNGVNGESRGYDFNLDAEAGKTYFQSFHNIETQPYPEQ